MYLFLNELSFNLDLNEISEKKLAKKYFIDFVIFLRELKAKGMCEGVLINGNIYDLPIWNGYRLADWLKDETVDKTYRQYFRTFLLRHCSYVCKEDLSSEFFVDINHKRYSGIGCAFAVEYQNPILSVLTNEFWKKIVLEGVYISIDSEGELFEYTNSVENWTNNHSLEELKKRCVKKVYEEITSGQDLWERREILFPNLIFCASVKDQLYEDPERFHIVRIMERLQIIQNYFSEYDGWYNPAELGLNARTESESVKTDPDLKRYRLFRLPNGEEVYFFDHISFSGKFSGRIHFYPERGTNRCYIGYIGRHLPTKKY